MFISYLLARLTEASTWRGIIGLATAAGVSVSPEQVTGIVSLGMAAAGSVGVFVGDKK